MGPDLSWDNDADAQTAAQRADRDDATDRGDARVSIRLNHDPDRARRNYNVGYTQQKDPVLVVLQLTGGNDYLNTVIPYNDPLYQDNRKAVGIGDNQILPHRQGLRLPAVPGADEEVLG